MRSRMRCCRSSERSCALRDTWVFDVARGAWRELAAAGAAPALEAHKAVVSGFDVHTFGGHSGPGAYPRYACGYVCRQARTQKYICIHAYMEN